MKRPTALPLPAPTTRPRAASLTFAPGETSKTIDVLVAGDATVESDETFVVRLTSATGATVTTAQATGTIRNDDQTPLPPTPTLSIGSTTVVEGNSGTVNMLFTVTLSQAATSPVTVKFATADITATRGQGLQRRQRLANFRSGRNEQEDHGGGAW